MPPNWKDAVREELDRDGGYLRRFYADGDTGVIGYVTGAVCARLRLENQQFGPFFIREVRKEVKRQLKVGHV